MKKEKMQTEQQRKESLRQAIDKAVDLAFKKIKVKKRGIAISL